MDWHEGLRRIKLPGWRFVLSNLVGAVIWFLLLLVFHARVFELFLIIRVPLVLGLLLLLAAWVLEGFLRLHTQSSDRL